MTGCWEVDGVVAGIDTEKVMVWVAPGTTWALWDPVNRPGMFRATVAVPVAPPVFWTSKLTVEGEPAVRFTVGRATTMMVVVSLTVPLWVPICPPAPSSPTVTARGPVIGGCPAGGTASRTTVVLDRTARPSTGAVTTPNGVVMTRVPSKGLDPVLTTTTSTLKAPLAVRGIPATMVAASGGATTTVVVPEP